MLARFAALAALPLLAFAQTEIAGNGTGIDKNGKYEIASEGIRANFIAYGASISNLFIEDIHGEVRDIVLGFDNASYYEVDKQHPHLGGVPGRYANRIKNSTFEIDGQVYEIDANEHGGLNTLHGGCKYIPELWNKSILTRANTFPSKRLGLAQLDRRRPHPGQHHLLPCRR